VGVGMEIDEARSDRPTRGVDARRGRDSETGRNSGYAVLLDPDIGAEAGFPGAVDHVAVGDDEIQPPPPASLGASPGSASGRGRSLYMAVRGRPVRGSGSVGEN